MSANIIGLDIGGANLKAARADRQARSAPFELWRHPGRLGEALRDLLAGWPIERLAVAMTGELCDCFATKKDGVRSILASVAAAFSTASVEVWSTTGAFVSTDIAAARPTLVAAANWHAQATWVARQFPNALLIDVGSTTTDIVPIQEGAVAASGLTDEERLRTGELVYTGARRTPIAALVSERVAAERFATAHDAYLLLGEIDEDPSDTGTADGRPATHAHAHARLARMLGGDADTITRAQATDLARQAAGRQRALIGGGIRQVIARMARPPAAIVLSGSGETLALASWRQAGMKGAVVSLTDHLGPELAAAACAYAVACLSEPPA
jgi:hypothetical protein